MVSEGLSALRPLALLESVIVVSEDASVWLWAGLVWPCRASPPGLVCARKSKTGNPRYIKTLARSSGISGGRAWHVKRGTGSGEAYRRAIVADKMRPSRAHRSTGVRLRLLRPALFQPLRFGRGQRSSAPNQHTRDGQGRPRQSARRL